ncbi:MAG: CCA tRNA nucleotidyltransferase [Vulcanococcus sp.]
MAGAGADGAIVPPSGSTVRSLAGDARLAWQRLAPEHWPVPLQAFPAGTAVVGGAVRDALLDRLGERPDIDLVLPGDAVELCRQLRRRHGGSAVVLDGERSIARLVIDGWSLDLARQEGGSLNADLHRRDYTINAMALPLAEPDALVDPLGGAADLAAAQLVAVSEANLLDDPLRLLRGLRLAGELGFQLNPQTLAWIHRHHARLGEVAGERVLAELEKLAAAADGGPGLAAVQTSGLLQPWQGQPTPHSRLQAERSVALLQQLTPAHAAGLSLSPDEASSALPLARLAALLDGRSLHALRSSRRLQQRVERLRHWWERLGPASSTAEPSNPASTAEDLPEPERLHLHRQLEDDLPALVLTWPPQAASTAQRWLQRWRDPNDPLFHPKAAIDGGSLQRELALPPSPQLGQLLDRLMLERAFGRIQTAQQALQAARHWLDGSSNPDSSGSRRD